MSRPSSFSTSWRILYPHMRHEVLNELGRDKVYADILDFLNLQIQ